MEGIYFKDGVYILVEETEGQKECFYNEDIGKAHLYGGRVLLEAARAASDSYGRKTMTILNVDGIGIRHMNSVAFSSTLSYTSVVAHLNSIEANGVDAFLQHYKQNIEFTYNELKALSEQTANSLAYTQEDKRIQQILVDVNKVRELLIAALAILFNLRLLMPTGLENAKVESIYQSIIDSMA